MAIPPVFISHSHLDNLACRDLVDFVAQQFPGVDIFFDESNLHGGDDWIARIQREVIAHPYFIVILSRYSVVAEWVREETNLALSRSIADKAHRKVIPVLVDAGLQMTDIDGLAPLLTMRQIINLAPGGPTTARDDLLRVLRGEASGEAPHVDPTQLADLERARDLATQTHAEVAAGHWLNAITIGRRAVRLPGNERDAALWGDLGLAYLRADMVSDAITTLTAALTHNHYRADLWQLQAAARQRLGKLEGAEGASEAWEEAEIWTSSPAAKLGILAEHADALIAARRWDEAAFVVGKAVELAPTDAVWQARQRTVQLGSGADTQEAALLAAEQGRQDTLLPLRLLTLGFALVPAKDVIVPPTVAVPSATFAMGGDSSSSYGTNGATVPVAAFRIGIYPVTVAEWVCAVVAKAVPEPNHWASQQQKLDHPVVYISWLDVVAYAAWLSQQTGQTWRLPTEAEWEYAARGTDGRFYPWGNQWDDNRANTSESGIKTTTPIGTYADKGDASPFGTHDQAGNVWEWTSSLGQGDKPYDASICEKPDDRTSGRVLRGGSMDGNSQYARVASRGWGDPAGRGNGLGARLVLAVELVQ